MKNTNLYCFKTVLLSLFLLFTTFVNAQEGANDAAFNPTDLGLGDGANSTVKTTAIQSDGKIIIAGSFTSYNGKTINRIARLNTDGSLDTSFNPGTGANSDINTISIQTDGKIIIGGNFNIYNGISIQKIARLNSDGTLDITFNVGSGVNGNVNTCAIQSDGKILIGGSFGLYNFTLRSGIARINTDGSLDPSFNVVTANDNNIKTVAIQSDGKIIVGGDCTTDNGITRKRIARLNANGTLDATFNVGTGPDNIVYTCAIQSNGKIIIGGNFTNYNGSPINRIARLNTDGSLDPTFNIGTGLNSYPLTSMIQNDGKIIIGGDFTSYNGSNINRIARLNADGTLDATFNVGTGISFFVNTIAIQSDGKIIIGGYFSFYNGILRNNIIRLNTNAVLDVVFNVGTGANGNIYTSAIQSDGKLLIGGSFTEYNGISRGRIARLNTDGTLDMSFNPGTGASFSVNTLSIQSDGKIIIGGNFAYYNGIGRYYLARLNTDGSLDVSFKDELRFASVKLSAIQSDGKIIVVGDNYTLLRLNTDGSNDASFNIGTGANQSINTLLIQSDGKIIIGGNFTAFNGITRNKIARLNTNGSLDATFTSDIGANYDINSLSIQSDGKIIIGGEFTTYNGISRNHIARLNSDGTLDASFNPGTGTDVNVAISSIQSNGKIIIAGRFISYNSTPRNRIARLNTDGSLDVSFTPGTGANGQINTTIIQSDGKIVIGGQFNDYDGARRNRIARVLASTTIPVELVDFTGIKTDEGNLLTWRTVSEINNRNFEVERRQETGNAWETLGFIKANNKASTYQFIDKPLPNIINYYRLRQIDNDGKETLSKVIALIINGKNKLKIFPNPVLNTLILEKGEIGEIGSYQIFNLLGQEVRHGSSTQRIDVSTLTRGTYLLKVDTEQVMFVKL